MPCNRYCKSTVNAYTNVSTTLATGALMPINTNYKITGNSIRHTAGSTAINIVKAGLYEVSFYATSTIGTTAGAVSLQLYRNGVAVPSGIASQTPTAATDIESFAGGAIIEVNDACCGAGIGSPSVDLTFVNTGVEGVYSYFSVKVVKIA